MEEEETAADVLLRHVSRCAYCKGQPRIAWPTGRQGYWVNLPGCWCAVGRALYRAAYPQGAYLVDRLHALMLRATEEENREGTGTTTVHRTGGR